MKRIQTLAALFSFSGFRARSRLQGLFGDPHARLIILVRRKKTAVCSGCGTRHRAFYDRQTRRVRDIDAAGWCLYLAVEQRRVACSRCREIIEGVASCTMI